ncbi:MAG: hypothetical protein P1U81_13375 [Verrucomicrobiales bacterium]|nr:hypothetical protein [Verrucomicrobiales bacterium]
MSIRNRLLVKGIASLLVLWAVVFAVVKVAGSMKPTVEKLEAFAEANPLSEIEDPDERKEVIGGIVDMLNAMEPSEVALLSERNENDPRRQFMRELTPGEQLYFLERRVGRAFQQMMISFNEMERDERRRIVERTLKRMKDNADGGPPGALDRDDPELAGKIADAGLKAYYADASVETKIDLAPLLEEMQRTMGRLGGPNR